VRAERPGIDAAAVALQNTTAELHLFLVACHFDHLVFLPAVSVTLLTLAPLLPRVRATSLA
jgi:hypothetical protein